MYKPLIGLLLLALLGCGGSADDAQMIVGSWWAGAAPDWATNVGSTGNNTAIEIAFTSDGQYSAIKEQLTSDGTDPSANAQVENGTYTLTDGSTLTCMPVNTTCPGLLSRVVISFTGGELDLNTSSGVISLQKNGDNSISGDFTTYGCFFSDGEFVPE